MRVFFLAAAIAVSTVSAMFLTSIAIAALVSRDSLPQGTMLYMATSDAAAAEAADFAIAGIIAIAVALVCLKWPRVLVALVPVADRVARHATTRRRKQGRFLVRILSAPFALLHAYMLLVPVYAVGQAIHELLDPPVRTAKYVVYENHSLADSGSGVFMFFGVTSISCGLLIIRSRGRSCSRCTYRMNSWRGSADRCPECGNLWKRLGGTLYGRRISRAWLFAGVALLVAALGVWAFAPY
jgi:hypothetical protein